MSNSLGGVEHFLVPNFELIALNGYIFDSWLCLATQMNEEFRTTLQDVGWFSHERSKFLGKKRVAFIGANMESEKMGREETATTSPLYKAYIWWIIKGPPSQGFFPHHFPYEICTKLREPSSFKASWKASLCSKNMGMSLKTWVFVSRWRPSVTLVESLVPWIVSPAKLRADPIRDSIYGRPLRSCIWRIYRCEFYVVLIHHNRPYIWVFGVGMLGGPS